MEMLFYGRRCWIKEILDYGDVVLRPKMLD